MNITRRIGTKGIPLVCVTFDTPDQALKFKQELTFTGKSGNINKKRPKFFQTSGVFAIETLKKLGIPLPLEFSAWKPKQKAIRGHLIADDEILAHARQFKYRCDWRKACKNKDHADYYQLVHGKRQYLLEACFAHMDHPVDPFKSYQVYAYEWPDKTAYVGLTCRPKSRHGQHTAHGCVFDKGGQPELKIIGQGLGPSEASLLEKSTLEDYKIREWILLNKDDGGSLGQLRLKYVDENLVNMAKQCSSLQDFKAKFYGPFQVAERRKLLGKIVEICRQECGWPRPKYGQWALKREDIVKVIKDKGFRSTFEWFEKDKYTYHAASRRGLVGSVIQETSLIKRRVTTHPIQ